MYNYCEKEVRVHTTVFKLFWSSTLPVQKKEVFFRHVTYYPPLIDKQIKMPRNKISETKF